MPIFPTVLNSREAIAATLKQIQTLSAWTVVNTS